MDGVFWAVTLWIVLRFLDRAPERTVLISLFCVGPHQPPLCPWPGTVLSYFEPLHQGRDAVRLLNDARLLNGTRRHVRPGPRRLRDRVLRRRWWLSIRR